MLKSKKWVTSIAVGTALMGASLAVGVVQTQVVQPVSVQAKTKMATYRVKKYIWKDGKWHDIVEKVPYGKTTVVKQPKYKGYKDIFNGEIAPLTVSKKGKIIGGASPFMFMKVLSSKQQKKNAKSKKAVTVKTTMDYFTSKSSYKTKKVSFKVKGLVGTLLKVKAPKVKGYKSKVKTIHVGIQSKKVAYAVPNGIVYVKK